jgi:hypothetical protein
MHFCRANYVVYAFTLTDADFFAEMFDFGIDFSTFAAGAGLTDFGEGGINVGTGVTEDGACV